MRINHNISSMITQGSLAKVSLSTSKNIEKLSTGLRINRASDDAAGLGVSEQLRTQVRGLGQALKNTQDAIAMLNIADGALQEQTDILQRMRELVIQAKNDTYTDTERAYMFTEFKGMMNELDRIAQVTNFNGMQLFATPEASGLDTERLYTIDHANGFDTGEYKTNHATNDARDIWTDDRRSIFGENDLSSAHHFNMMVGANYEANDIAAYHAASGSWGDRGSTNLITIQFGQMDSHSLLTLYPGNAGTELSDANALWDSFKMNTDFSDMGDADLWLFSTGASVDTTGEKLNFLLKILDGDGAEFDSQITTFFGNGQGGDGSNVTGIERVNRMRSSIGAWINRLEHSVNNTMNQMNNMQAAESLIRDADFAAETATFTRNSILTNASTAMLAQANMKNQSVLQLLG